ncbi:MAG: hypothetical protein ACXWTT_03035 [Methylobacter sp.]
MNDLQRSRNIVFIVLCYMTIMITFFIHGGDDTYWHIPVGEWIVNNLEVPRTGLFSQTKENAEWISHEWLSEVIMYLIYHALGWPGLVILAIVAVTASILIALNYILEQLPPIRALCLILLSYGMLLGHIMPRPHIFVLPIMTFWFVEMLRASEQHKAPSWRNLPLLVLWANTHGSFLISIPYALFFAFESVITAPSDINRNELIKKWGIFIALSVLCLLITPFGLEGLLFPLKLTGQKYATSMIKEWAPVNFQTFQFFEVWILIIISFALTQKIKIPLLRLIFLLGLLHLSLKHARHAFDLLSLQGSLLLAAPLAKHWLLPPRQKEDRLTVSSLLPMTKKGRFLLFSVLCSLLVYVFAFKTIEYSDSKKTIAMLATLRQFEPLGKVFNSYEMCGYLINQGYKPYIDSRAELYKDDFIKSFNEAVSLAGGEKPLENLLTKYDASWTFLVPKAPAIAYFNLHPDWIPVFANEFAVIHVRKGRWPQQTIDQLKLELQKQSDAAIADKILQ